MYRPHTEIIRRRVNIDFASAKARGWHLSRADVEDFLNGVSFVFPTGEKFFIESVHHYEDRITDPALKDDVRRFIYQEAMHSKEHDRCNKVLNEAYPYGEKIENFTAWGFRMARRFTPKASQLAATCALEHFTAMLADTLLTNQDWFIAESDPAFAALWMWHAVEETEHKAVCFDVYQQIMGKGVFSYLHRVAVMASTTLCFLLTLSVALRQTKKANRLKAAAGGGPSPPTPGLWHLLKEIASARLYFDYYRPSFHPWDHDNAFRIEQWKQRYQDFGTNPDAALKERRVLTQ